jgi:hypothetical protein
MKQFCVLQNYNIDIFNILSNYGNLVIKHETFLRRSKSIHSSYETIYSSEIIMTTKLHIEYTLFFNSLLQCDEYKSKES